MQNTVTRRDLLAAGGTVAMGAALLASGAHAVTAHASEATAAPGTLDENGRYIPSFMNAPEAPTSWDEEYDCDVAVVGLGVAGICATRAAMEEGVNVVAVEQCPTFSYRSAQFAAINSSVHKACGCEFDEEQKQRIVQEFMKDSSGRANQRIWERWANESGQILDWFLAGKPDYRVLDSRLIVKDSQDVIEELGLQSYLDDYSAVGGDDSSEVMTVTVLDWPNNDAVDPYSNQYPQYFCPANILEGQAPLHNAHLAMFEEAPNVELLFNTKGEQLIMEDGRVVGLFAKNADGKTVRVNAANGVVISAGDYMANTEMCDYYMRSAFEYPSYIWTSFDADGNSTSNGSGILMGLWAGAKVEPGEHAQMVHGFGGGLGFDPFLFVDGNGERFMNENSRGDLFSVVSTRAAKKCYWQIFDANYAEQVPTMPAGHACCYKVVEDAQDMPWGNFLGSGIRTRDDVESGCTCVCNSIEELAAAMEVDAETLKATIDRYNELAAKGVDEDFGKRADLLYPIEQPPFYASKFTPADQMRFCALTGLWSDQDARVYDNDLNVLPGLYAAGNSQGNRFNVDYATTFMGVSHSMAMTYGYIAGKNAAAKLS